MAIPGIPYERRLLIMADPRDKALQDYRKKLLEHKEIDGRLKECECTFPHNLVPGPASVSDRAEAFGRARQPTPGDGKASVQRQGALSSGPEIGKQSLFGRGNGPVWSR